MVISQEIPNSVTAGGILLFRLLAAWPSDRLTIFGPTPPVGANTLECKYQLFHPTISSIQFTRLAPFAPLLGCALPTAIPSVKIDPPAVVLSVMQSSAYYRAAQFFASYHQIPLALIVHDDPEEIERIWSWSRPLIRKANGSIYRFARKRFCISPELCDLLDTRYGAPGEVLYPNRSSSTTARPRELNQRLRRHGGLVIGYAGTLTYGYGDKLKQLLPEFRRQGSTLRIYSVQKPPFANEKGVEYAGASASPDMVWPRVKEECDVVILPYADPEFGHEALYRTHFPSKLPEYLALGMPIIIAGNPAATGIKWGMAHPYACIVIRSGEGAEWKTEISRLSSDANYRLALGDGALAAAAEFDPGGIEAFFHSSLVAVAADDIRRSPRIWMDVPPEAVD